MTFSILRFCAVLLSALTMALGFCHIMEMPARMTWDQSLWVGSTVHGGLYRMFGTLGAAIDVAAIVCLIALAWRERRAPKAIAVPFWIAAALFVAALLIWFAAVAPVNAELANWLTRSPPADWAAWRAQWEGAHAFNTLLQIAGFAALVIAILREKRDLA